MALLSVVVSVYNSESYIQKCLESVLGQTFQDLECIIVDDGSTDKSYSVCENYLKDSRVRLIHQENLGSVAARNKGVNLAAGKYISIIDSDDWLDPDMYEKMIQAAVANDADVAVSAYIEERGDSSIRRCMHIKSGVYEKRQMEYLKKRMIYFGGGGYHEFGINPALWNKIFKTELIKAECSRVSTEIRRSSDAVVSFPAMFKSKKAVIMNELYPYHYRIHDSSLGSWRDTKYFYRIKILLEQLGKLESDDGQKFDLYNQLRHYALLLTVLGMSGSYPDKSLRRLSEIWCELGYAKSVIKDYELLSLSRQMQMKTDEFLTHTAMKEIHMIANDKRLCFIMHGYAEKMKQFLKNRINSK